MTTENTNNKPLNDMQDNARAFWRLAGSNFAPHYYIYSQLLEYQATYAGTDNSEYQGKVTQLLNGIGYGTDMDTISEQFTAGLNSELGYWHGTYYLFDAEGQCYKLTISQDEALLMLPTTALDLNQVTSSEDFGQLAKITSTDYQDGLLKLSNQQYAFELRFSFPYTEEELNDSSIHPDFFAQTTQPICKGTFVIKNAKTSVPQEIIGRRGTYTQKGIQDSADGDPIETWLGRYILYELTEEGKFHQAIDLLDITVNEEGISLQWGKEIVGYDIQFNNNTLSAVDDSDPVNRYMLQFSCLQDGRKQLIMAIVQEGFTTIPERKFIGYWLDHPVTINLPSQLAHTQASLTMSSIKLYAQAQTLPEIEIDISTGSTISADLPIGVPGNPYTIRIKLLNIPTGSKYDWTLDTASQKKGTITVDADHSSAVLNLAWVSSDVSNLQTVTIDLTPQTGTKITLKLSISVQNLPAISISPTTVPAIFRNNTSTIVFSANGGTGLFTWEAENTPTGFSFDPATQTLTGTINNLQESLDTYSFKVKVSASNAIMNPGHFTIPLQVQEPPQLASQEISYVVVALGIIGSLFAVLSLPKKFYDDYKAVQKNRGDPTFEKRYKRTKLIGDSLKVSLDALGGKRFTHHIENAIQFDSKYADWQRRSNREPAIERYSNLIHEINNSLTEIQNSITQLEEKIAEERMSVDPNHADIKIYEDAISAEKARENRLKVTFAQELTGLSREITQDYRDAKRVEKQEMGRRERWRKNASKHIFGE